VSHFLVIFSRIAGEVPVLERYEDAHEAAMKLFETEAKLRDDPDHGVVLLYAEDEESLRRTHGSYFLGFDELLETAGG
jgi:hypothetical protein